MVPWFKVDDRLAFHPKTLTAGNAAMGMWVRAGSWSMQMLTDGFVPADVVAAMGGDDLASQLVGVGMWDVAEGGYQFHDWSHFQPSKVVLLAEREAAAERKRLSRARSKGSGRG